MITIDARKDAELATPVEDRSEDTIVADVNAALAHSPGSPGPGLP